MASRAVLAALFAGRLLAADATFCIGGTVVNAVTGEPIRHAAVSMPEHAELSDAAGAFHFCGLAAGNYAPEAERPGFVAAGARITVGPSREDLILRLRPLALIKGRIADSDGNPVEGAAVQLLAFAIGHGRRQVHMESATTTDDRGEYRIPQLKPGRYLVRAAGWPGPAQAAKDTDPVAFAPVYYGGAAELASASPITLEAGQELSADFSVNMEPAFRIRGTVGGYAPREPVKVELLGTDGEATAAPATFDPSTGSFQVSYVPHGSYTLRATQDGSERLRGEQAVQIGAADQYDVLLALAGAVQLKGMVRVAASGEQTPAPNCAAALSPAMTSMFEEGMQSPTGDDGEFAIDNVLPGRYRLAVECVNGYIASLRWGGTDLLAHNEIVITGVAPAPVEAVLNTDGATVDITPATEDDSTPAWLVLMPESGDEFYARFALFKHKLSLSGIAPGNYQLYAWTGSPYAFEYANPGAKQAWAGRAAGIQLSARDHQSVTVKVTAGEPQ